MFSHAKKQLHFLPLLGVFEAKEPRVDRQWDDDLDLFLPYISQFTVMATEKIIIFQLFVKKSIFMFIEVLRVFTLHILVETRYWYYSIDRGELLFETPSETPPKSFKQNICLDELCITQTLMKSFKSNLYFVSSTFQKNHSILRGFSQPVAGEVWPLLLEKAHKKGGSEGESKYTIRG